MLKLYYTCPACGSILLIGVNGAFCGNCDR